MNLKRFIVAMSALMALGAIVASSASATVSTTAAQWYTGTTKIGAEAEAATLPEGKSQPAEAEILEGPAVFTVTILGTPVELTANKISCVECKIENKKVTGTTTPIAFGSGKIKFEEVSAMLPTNCTVSSETGTVGEVVTKSLVIHADWMDTNTANQHAFVEFLPASGSVFATFQLSGTGCSAIANSYNVTGSVDGESVNNTAVAAEFQDLVLSNAVQGTSGKALKVGANTAILTGKARFRTGTEKPTEGKKFFMVK